jgi:hypothetical protein
VRDRSGADGGQLIGAVGVTLVAQEQVFIGVVRLSTPASVRTADGVKLAVPDTG